MSSWKEPAFGWKELPWEVENAPVGHWWLSYLKEFPHLLDCVASSSDTGFMLPKKACFFLVTFFFWHRHPSLVFRWCWMRALYSLVCWLMWLSSWWNGSGHLRRTCLLWCFSLPSICCLGLSWNPPLRWWVIVWKNPGLGPNALPS